MNLNSDFNQRVAQLPSDAVWSDSPLAGVQRRMLDRIGGELARATSIVRYAAGSQFDQHRHGGGEEIFVLQGVLSDEHGDYPAGTYLRNPPGTSHTPFSEKGCMLFVKLWQFAAGDTKKVKVETSDSAWYPGTVPGLSVMPLHEYEGVSTALVRWAPHTQFKHHAHFGGEEILVLAGVFHDENGQYPTGTWLRSPPGSRHTPYTNAEGALIYVKVGGVGAQFLQPVD
jgi:anti-sigma factor ChrR (cupin superfamily)